MIFSEWENGYSAGWEEGKYEGYTQGRVDAITDYESRISKMWAELHTLNARIDYLTNVIDKRQNEN